MPLGQRAKPLQNTAWRCFLCGAVSRITLCWDTNTLLAILPFSDFSLPKQGCSFLKKNSHGKIKPRPIGKKASRQEEQKTKRINSLLILL